MLLANQACTLQNYSSLMHRERHRDTERGERGIMRLLSLLDDEKEVQKQEDRARERKLHEAAMKGTVTSLLDLLDHDPLILNSISSSSSISDTPLHVSALLGHHEFAKELLNRRTQLAAALNSQGLTPLHLASAKGYVEIVKELLSVNPDVCSVLDHDGRSPLHLAAIKGRVGVLTEFIRVNPELTRVLTSDGDTCLHLCVKYSRLEALKVLVEEGIKKDDVFVNWKDQNGNTILHLAVAKKQLETVKFLLINTGIDVHAPNANGCTALDVLSQSPRDLRDMDIKQCLKQDRATMIKSIPSIIGNGDIAKVSSITQSNVEHEEPNKHKHTDWLGRKRSSLMIVSSLLATVAFQAGLSPPGGVWSDQYRVDSNGKPVANPHDVGTSVMAYIIPEAYRHFMIFNTIAFLASLSIIMLSVSGLPMKRRRWMWTQMVTMWIALSALTVTYFITLINMTPNKNDGTLYQVTKISVLGWLTVMGIVFIGNAVRAIRYVLRKHGYMEEKEREPLIYAEDDEL